MGSKLDITGEKFNRLTAIKEVEIRTSNGGVQWEFMCSCGKKSIHAGARVKAGQIVSCGCSRKTDNPLESLIGIIFRDYQASAKVRKIDFNLTFEDFKEFTQHNCYYCNVEPEIRTRKFTARANGLDRIDSNKGYELGNIRSCCKICNMAKNDLSSIEFEEWLNRLVNYKNRSDYESGK